MIKAMTVEEFMTLEAEDFQNGAILDAIYSALKELEELKSRIEMEKRRQDNEPTKS